MVPGLDDYQLIVGGTVDKAVLVIDPPGPEAGKSFSANSPDIELLRRSLRSEAASPQDPGCERPSGSPSC